MSYFLIGVRLFIFYVVRNLILTFWIHCGSQILYLEIMLCSFFFIFYCNEKYLGILLSNRWPNTCYMHARSFKYWYHLRKLSYLLELDMFSRVFYGYEPIFFALAQYANHMLFLISFCFVNLVKSFYKIIIFYVNNTHLYVMTIKTWNYGSRVTISVGL